MTYYDAEYTDLPDPELDSAFYDKVPTRRLLAWVIDGGLTLFITFLIATFLTLGLGFFIFPVLWMVIGFVYRVITISSASATIGMRIFGIEFRTKTGQKFTTSLAVAHTALYLVFAGIVVLHLLSIVMILSTRYGQSLPDTILGTTAINRPAK